MKTEAENLSPQQSLDIITNMIMEVKIKARKRAFHFLLWGWVVVLANLGMYALTIMHYQHPYIVWLITIPAWVFSLYKGYTEERQEKVNTHFGQISAWLWIWFGVCIFTLVAFGYKLNFQLNPLIITISSIPTLVSGALLRFRPLMLGGVALWIFGIAGFLTPVVAQPLVGAVAVFFGYLIPGYLLKNKKY